MLRFEYSTTIAAPVETVFGFHKRPDALELLTPPGQKIRVLGRTGGIETGAVAVFRIWMGPIPVKWVALHTEYEENALFADQQIKGPFRYWRHRHVFEPAGANRTRLTDSIEFSLKGGRLADWLLGVFLRRRLQKLFKHRHEVTRRHCERL